MIDEIFDRNYQHGRAELNSTIVSALRTFGDAVGEAFAVLNRIEYSAPWARSATKVRHN